MRLRPLLLLVLLSFPLSAQIYRYSETTSNLTIQQTVTVTRNDSGGYLITAIDAETGDTDTMTLDSHCAALVWVTKAKDGSTISYRRSGNSILVEGVQHGVSVSKTVAIDALPWYGSTDFGIGDFVRSKQATGGFWVINPDTLKATKMSVNVIGKNTVPYLGNQIDTVKIRVTAAGVPAIFFNLLYWYRPTDGLLIHFEGAMGPPGTPKTTTQLISEE